MLKISKNLRRLGIVSVSALMLLGIGASATSAHNNVHADDIDAEGNAQSNAYDNYEFGGSANAAAHDKFYAASNAEVFASEGMNPYTTGNVSSILSHDQIAKIIQRNKEDNGNYVPSPSDFQGNGWLAHDGLNSNNGNSDEPASTNTASSQNEKPMPTNKPTTPSRHQEAPAPSIHHAASSQGTNHNTAVVSHHQSTVTPSAQKSNTRIIMPKPTSHRAIAPVSPSHTVNTVKTAKHVARHAHVNKMQQQINRLQRELRKIAKSIQQFKNQGMKRRGQNRKARARKHVTRRTRHYQGHRAHRIHNHRHVNK